MGMNLLNYREREVLFMTPRKFWIVMNAYHDFHSGKKEEKISSIDDLP